MDCEEVGIGLDWGEMEREMAVMDCEEVMRELK
jgi:hypothetical protein